MKVNVCDKHYREQKILVEATARVGIKFANGSSARGDVCPEHRDAWKKVGKTFNTVDEVIGWLGGTEI